MISLIKAERYYNLEYEEIFKNVHDDTSLYLVDRNPFLLTIPLLVIDAPLFYGYLNEKSEIELEETTWGSVNVKLPWNILETNHGLTSNVQVVRHGFLDDFAAGATQLFQYLSSAEVVHPIPQIEELQLVEKEKE